MKSSIKPLMYKISHACINVYKDNIGQYRYGSPHENREEANRGKSVIEKHTMDKCIYRINVIPKVGKYENHIS